MGRLGRFMIILTVLGLVLTGCGQKDGGQAQPPLQGDINELASEFVALLVKEDFTAAAQYFDATMLQALPPEKLGQTWTQVKEQAGPYKHEIGRQQETTQGYEVININSQFEKAALNIRVVFNADKRIAGLFFAPGQSANGGNYQPPGYARMDQVVEQEVVVGAGEWALPGTLTLPDGPGPWPVVVLVHGSGPNDRDETIGPNKPFKDLALGLASRGVGVLRYDKRTFTHGMKIAASVPTLTIQEETVEDAVAAVKLLKNTDKVDPGRIYVLGHSLGGMLAPRIGAQSGEMAGLILMAGAARPLEDLVVEQTIYIAEADGAITDTKKTGIEAAEQFARMVKDPALDANTPASQLMGAPAAYWLDLRTYQPLAAAQSINVPMLILQGQRDYQVTMADFQLWQSALQGKKGVVFKSFPALNHLMMAGSGPSTPEEYMRPDHVDQAVVEAIVDFII